MKVLIFTHIEFLSDTRPIFLAVLDKWLHTVAFVQWTFLRPVVWLPTLVLLTSLALPAATFTVTTTNDTGTGSLRQAITDANSNAGPDVITFNISGAKGIMPGSALPPITDPVVLDGTTQPGFTNQPIIELNGVSAPSANGFLITAGQSTVRGLVINRFKVNGIQIQTGGGNVIEGNFIGLGLDGTTDRGNGDRGILITGSASNRIGGTVLAARNVISGNATAGIRLDAGAAENLIVGNIIGLDVSGSVRKPNGNGIGINAASHNRIGGNTPGSRNVISGNADNGVALANGATDNVIEGNYIGLAPEGDRFLRNADRGIYISDSATVRNLIGGTNAGAGNVIAGNGGSGIRVDDKASGNALLGNSIFANGTLGITLGDGYVTPNDPGDVDTGPNRFQNYPVLNSATLSSCALIIHGTLDSSANETFRIELFASDVCNASGYGEGQIFLEAVQVVTDGSGHANFAASFAIPTNRFHFVSATVTDSGNNTSEFSRSVLVGGDGCVIESTFDDSGHGWLVWHNDDTIHFGTWTNAGGNPGGSLHRSDNGGDSKTAFWQAPAEFLGPQAAAYGGCLEFDLKQTPADNQFDGNDVVLIGGGLQLVFDVTIKPAATWTPYRVFLHEAAGWRVGALTGPVATEAQLRLVLGSLTVLRIRAEYRNGDDTDGLDNVRLVFPAPTLTMRNLGNALCVEWPVSASCFQLECTETLSPTAWTPVVALTQTTNGINRLFPATGTGIRFYRLKK